MHRPMLVGTFGPDYVAHAVAGSYGYVLYETPFCAFIAVLEHRGMPHGPDRQARGEIVKTLNGCGTHDRALHWFVETFLSSPERARRYHKLVHAKPGT